MKGVLLTSRIPKFKYFRNNNILKKKPAGFFEHRDRTEKIMTLMKDVKGDGHSLTAPRMTVGWAVYAVIAVFVLAIVATIGLFAFQSAKTVVAGTGAVPGAVFGGKSLSVSEENAMSMYPSGFL
jgi:hypothetical protein